MTVAVEEVSPLYQLERATETEILDADYAKTLKD